ncbi:hypothetical protein SAMN04490248_10797 [Salinihabitans flavidus]|uniref:Phytase-like domain-containing protein n=1 Tax=Salinihabitans flavidus TaxID=569882 RepID=A0A1H8QY01_9RHOB|nr:esterase-like activity of phytase family protein [Salinihabitans flavidus]SEO59092.1 hypothetical protein SAMN04490248_10797 [Salinihabitans flavidus]
MHRCLAVAVGALLVLSACQSDGAGQDEGAARHMSSLRWHVDAAWFGGWSGIEVEGSGAAMTVISDRGRLLTATLRRNAEGHIARVAVTGAAQVPRPNGETGDWTRPDAEGLAIGAGDTFVSFEGVHRVARLHGRGAHWLPDPPGRAGLGANASFEALAVDGAGRLLTLAEGTIEDEGDLPLHRFESGRWSTPFEIPRRGRFLPVGADVGPDGLFYLLERDFTGIGFRSRVRRFDLSGSEVRSEETLLQTGTGVHDNLEGLAVWRDAAGRIRLTMISDDNFRMIVQRTEIVEYVLPDVAR